MAIGITTGSLSLSEFVISGTAPHGMRLGCYLFGYVDGFVMADAGPAMLIEWSLSNVTME